ncbi:TA system VapC family ribonuclease toxin [Tessaracoccus caeni]|uniref:TA system VapC family ribonuclease toxin n=1 Tax=Tessaracoccus caeni TaxID=3031239 RepID=UPI0023DBF9C8|nr:TA system VapC family ribonuclease toxin [Tessaracoccus caeni]MDF1487885.1 PIN domain-containing protein [Tessaracoccus caeni]
MIVPDVNLLIYAHVDGYSQHDVARRWWGALLSSTQTVGIVSPVAMGFVRIVTNRRALSQPLSVDQAVDVVDGWFAQPQVRFLPDTEATAHRAFHLLRRVGTAGNLTTDAQIAAHAWEQAATVATNDADFARFPEIKITNPLV